MGRINTLKRLLVLTVFLMHCILIYNLHTFMGHRIRKLTSYLGVNVDQPTNANIINANTTPEVLKQSTSLPVNTFNLSMSTYRPDVCKGCFQNSFEILLENKDICKTRPGETLDLIIIIFTYKQAFKRREAIRKTWTQHSKNNTAITRYFFAFGIYPTRKTNIEVANEAMMHGDIVQAGFRESYYNLTYKTITMLGWVIKNCPNAKNIMKTDDDMWVNVPRILQRFNLEPLSKTLAGFLMNKAAPIRSKVSKWYTSLENYHRDMYPDFCSGTGYVMDMDTAINIHKTSVNVPFFHLEDVYVGFCLEYLGNGYHVQHTRGFNELKYPKSDLCSFKRFVLTGHNMSPRDIKNIWDAKC